MKKVSTFFILFCLTSFLMQAQTLSPTVVATQGGYAHNGDVSLQWTLGEGFVETTFFRSVVFTEGFNQPIVDFDNLFSINGKPNSSTAGKGNSLFGTLTFEVYPNPFQSYLNVSILGSFQGELEVRLVDLNGMILNQVNISPDNPTRKLNVEDLPAALYMIHVINESNGQVAVFRVFKFK